MQWKMKIIEVTKAFREAREDVEKQAKRIAEIFEQEGVKPPNTMSLDRWSWQSTTIQITRNGAVEEWPMTYQAFLTDDEIRTLAREIRRKEM